MKKNKKWNLEEVKKIFDTPFLNLIYKAQKIHRKNFKPNEIQLSSLISIKTGMCPEDCKYCPQSARSKSKIKKEKLMNLKNIIKYAKKAKNSGVTRFCMGAAWRNPKEKDIPKIEKIIKNVKSIGLETCMTLGMLNKKQAEKLCKAGLDYYNHNIDTSPKFYKNIISTRNYKDRLKTIDNVRKSGIKVCSGGIIGLGEDLNDRCEMLIQLANLDKQPESVPINMLVKVKGTKLENEKSIVDIFDFIRIIATARIMMPKSYIRLSAGREEMNEQSQVLCFIAGANSIFYGCKLLTTKNVKEKKDNILFKKLGIKTNLKKTKVEENKKNEIKYYDAS
ncbi:MAG: biotin synthase BioB [Enterobacteriaceae bacterium]